MNIRTNRLKKIIKILASDQHTISFAESCTGGRLVSEFSSVSGVSAVLKGSAITYSNEIKHKWLGVDSTVLEYYGAVSFQCVEQMLEGIMHIADSNYAIAISGIAGPTGGTEKKPVGTVYIGLQTPSSKEVFYCHFDGDRNMIQEQSVAFAITKLEEYLKI